LNKENIRQILDIERQAQAVRDEAQREAGGEGNGDFSQL